jgi:hypothetical protein
MAVEMRVFRPAAVVLSLLAAAGLAGCGSAPPITANAASELSGAVQAVRSAALAGNPSGAESDLASLQAKVNDLEKTGELSPTRATAILAAAHTVMVQLAAFSTSTTSTSTTTTTVSPSPARGTPGPDHDHHNDSGDKGQKSGKDGGGE